MGPLLFSAKSMAICMSSTHFSISDRELKRQMSGVEITAGKRVKQVRGQVPELPGGHDDGLPLAPQGKAVGHTPLIFTFLYLWDKFS